MISNNEKPDKLTIDYEFIHSISLASLIRLLVDKGVITTEDLLKYELEYKNFKANRHHNDFGNNHHHSHLRWLKRLASKRRWSRNLTARLFGWEWKKVKVRVPENEEID